MRQQRLIARFYRLRIISKSTPLFTGGRADKKGRQFRRGLTQCGEIITVLVAARCNPGFWADMAFSLSSGVRYPYNATG